MTPLPGIIAELALLLLALALKEGEDEIVSSDIAKTPLRYSKKNGNTGTNERTKSMRRGITPVLRVLVSK